jgi:hypothetical protein
MKTRALGIALLLLGAAGIASADQPDEHHAGMSGDWSPATADRDDNHRDGGDSHDWPPHRRSSTLTAPEIGPAGIVAALTLLGGAFAVLRGRRGMRPNG